MLKFEKVSYEQFKEAYLDLNPELSEAEIKQMYDDVKLPKRGTTGSAGYDIFAPYEFELAPKESIKIPTGIRALFDKGIVLQIYPRSGLGFKFEERLANSVGIIDSDFSNSVSEGHIFIKIKNDNDEGKTMVVDAGKAFVQGIFTNYLLTDDDKADGVRVGGFGSTDTEKEGSNV